MDTSAQWNFGTGNSFLPPYKFNNMNKADGFNLDVVQLTISKPLDESEWAAGYRADLWFGPDANALNTSSSFANVQDFAIRQAYVALRMPLGNGLDWKVGVFNSIIGYESLESGNNPNYTRSYGNTIEPQTHTGVLATYRFSDCVSASVGVANTVGPTINGRAQDPSVDPKAESYKTYMGSIALTAPKEWGFLSGSTLYAGVVNGFGASSLNGFNGPGNLTSWYVGSTIATPVTGLKFGAAWDVLDYHSQTGTPGSLGDAWAASVYASYQATEKLSFHVRGELFEAVENILPGKDNTQIWDLTGTIQYDLWKNVISRLEVRWDHGDEGSYFNSLDANGNFTRKNAVMLAANIIYKF